MDKDFMEQHSVIAPDWNDGGPAVTYIPFVQDGWAGYVVKREGYPGEVVYLRPSTGGDSPDVFVYHGLASDHVDRHSALSHVNLVSADRQVVVNTANGLFWSNDHGWGSLDSATRFTEWDTGKLDLPVGGKWMAFPEGAWVCWACRHAIAHGNSDSLETLAASDVFKERFGEALDTTNGRQTYGAKQCECCHERVHGTFAFIPFNKQVSQ